MIIKFSNISLLAVFFSLSLSLAAHAERLTKLKVPVSGYSEFSQKNLLIKPGDVVIEQKIVPTESVVITDEAEIFVRKTGNTRIRLRKGLNLYLAKDKKGRNVFCSLEPTFLATPKIGKPIHLQSCLMDSEGDGMFDRIFTSEKGQLDLPKLTQNLLVEQKKPFKPIKYQLAQPEKSINALSRILYIKSKKGQLVFEFQVQSSEGQWLRHARVEKGISSSPQIISVFGATFKLTNMQDERISLEAINGLKPEQLFELSSKMIGSKQDITFVK